ncbi:response regulator, partial [Acinetobacter baumannii]
DNPINREVIAGLLRRAGHRFAMAENGREAVDAVQAARYDVVLMDVQMPELDGIAATREIRALAGPAASVPIVALTANAFA